MGNSGSRDSDHAGVVSGLVRAGAAREVATSLVMGDCAGGARLWDVRVGEINREGGVD
jgi:hypothetical protein